jgi:uncharacterized tellurite resistance protein B-like protein
MSKISDYLSATFDITMNPDTRSDDAGGQALMASILLLAAQSDGSISTVESAELARLIGDKFVNSDEEKIRFAAESSQRIPELSNTSELIEMANRGLPLPQKENLMVMVLQIIAADERKERGELELLDKLVDGLEIPGDAMDRVYSRYFKDNSGK